jgi:exonuclease SbcD
MSMKIIATSDWHLGNLFHGNDRLPEHKHFLIWLLEQIAEQKPDALLIAGDIFDNGNPSAAAQTVYYEFLADATQLCPNMQVIITAGNHDSASRLEAPRPLLTRYHVEIRGNVRKIWQQGEKEDCKGKNKEVKVDFLEYKPQHSLRILPEDEEELTFKKWQKLINSELSERTAGELSDHFDYVMLKVKQEKLSSDDIKELEKLVNEKDAVLCKIQRIIPQLDLSTIQGSQHITSIEDIINRPPLDTLKEAFAIRHNAQDSK